MLKVQPSAAAPLVLGWHEWIALPDLGLPALKVKIDTGARTSALHADSLVELANDRVRFTVHPVPRRADVVVEIEAAVIDRREVTSSNGDQEVRPVIATRIEVAGCSWPIEITLTNRDTMRSRMLLGRQALQHGVLIDPAHRYRQPRLSFRLYPGYRRHHRAM
jgi:ribosomal protein S6--L-glutamate ligase